MLKKLFYASASILMLAIAYHLGANTAAAQTPGNPVVAAQGSFVYAANGDAYLVNPGLPVTTFTLVGNVFGGPTPAAHATWGQLKATYRK
jgi:hypothetical protein